MKTKFKLFLLAIAVLSVSSCASFFSAFQIKPDGVNDNLTYGHMDVSAFPSNIISLDKNAAKPSNVSLYIVPWETEYKEKKYFLSGGQGTYNLHDQEGNKISDLQYNAMIRGNLFLTQNLSPGDYYVGLICYAIGNTTTLVKLPKPDTIEECFKIEKDQLVYLGAYDMSRDYTITRNDSVTRDEATDRLESILADTEWSDFIASHR